jgi:hypothetical protein
MQPTQVTIQAPLIALLHEICHVSLLRLCLHEAERLGAFRKVVCVFKVNSTGIRHPITTVDKNKLSAVKIAKKQKLRYIKHRPQTDLPHILSRLQIQTQRHKDGHQ